MDSVANPPYSLDFTPLDYHLFGLMGRGKPMIIYYIHDEELQNMSTNVENTLENIYTFSNIALNFCEIFRCPSGKQHEIKNKGITF
jgi:hypothetical protein